MKNVIMATALFFTLGITACGNGNDKKNTVDTVVNTTDNTNTIQSDSTKPANAPGMDTVGGGRSMSSGAQDTSNKK